MRIDDIIHFDTLQMGQMREISKSYTQKELRQLKAGFDLDYLTSDQEQEILFQKEEVVKKGNRDSQELFDKRLIRFSSHAMLRGFQRVEDDVPSIGTYLIDRIIEADSVYKAQYKGYPQLSYTVLKDGDKSYFKTSISFTKVPHASRVISVMTVSQTESSRLHDIGFSRLPQTLTENSEVLSKLQELKRRLSSD